MTRRGVIVGGLATGVVVIAGGAFINRMVEFALTMQSNEVQGFGAVAISTYLIGMVPIVCVMMWAILSGQFADIEGPKFRMLELDREFERLDAARMEEGRHDG